MPRLWSAGLSHLGRSHAAAAVWPHAAHMGAGLLGGWALGCRGSMEAAAYPQPPLSAKRAWCSCVGVSFVCRLSATCCTPMPHWKSGSALSEAMRVPRGKPRACEAQPA